MQQRQLFGQCIFLYQIEHIMDRWRNKVAVVTGASSGIGAACVVDLIKSGMKVVALARREDRLKALRNSLPTNLQGNAYLMKCDVTDEAEVVKVFKWVESSLGGTHVLVNNAGIVRKTELMAKNNTADIKAVVDTNIMAVVYCVREAYQQMKAHKVAGHIVILNSIAGHSVPVFPCSSVNIYYGTKHAVTAMTETYRQEFSNDGSNVKITVSK